MKIYENSHTELVLKQIPPEYTYGVSPLS
jgi:hypothetical protein